MRFLLTFFLFTSTISFSQKLIDVVAYDLKIRIEDTTDVIDVVEVLNFTILENSPFFDLDLVAKDTTGKGMKILSISEYGIELDYKHEGNKLRIFSDRIQEKRKVELIIHYQGIPKDGLVIGHNKYGKRTFFGDNWPTRAQNWIACVDHPSDKAKVRFIIIAPKHYSVVANGKRYGYQQYDSTHNVTTYISRNAIPTKVMVFGAADFSMTELTTENNFSVQSWVYQDDSLASFSDLEVAIDPLDFFIEKIAPYPYEKLANVQSTTRFGGMENAGCIFYDENAFSGEHQMESVIAHEIAHQWFGNTVSETDWQHLWLSEGFATYLTNLHFEQKYGREFMNNRLKAERDVIISFENQVKRPVIDTITKDLMQLLNPNSYQKGSWFLHMLRNKLGDEVFWEGIEIYYDSYKYANASTDDFKRIMEKESLIDLEPFFDQWLKRNEMPNLAVTYKKGCRKNIMIITQLQEELFAFPLEVAITENGKTRTILLQFTKDTKFMELTVSKKGKLEIELDPNTKLLFRKTVIVKLQKK